MAGQPLEVHDKIMTLPIHSTYRNLSRALFEPYRILYARVSGLVAATWCFERMIAARAQCLEIRD